MSLPLDELPACNTDRSWHMLSDLRVIDLTSSIAGPYASMLLGDLGAEIIKIERPAGDDTRQWGPPFLDDDALWFTAVNRNKKSVVLDYSREEGRDALQRLIDCADVVITNQLPAVQRKLGVDATALRSAKPDLIHLSLTGFGLTGSNAHLPGYDLIAEGYSGVMDVTGEPENEPQKVGTPAADLLAGADAAFAILAALHRRRTTGAGCTIDTSLVESMTRFMTPRIVPYLGSGELPRRSGARDSVLAIYQTFKTADHPMTLAIGNNALWQRFCDAVGLGRLVDDEQFGSNAARRERRAHLVAEIQAILLTRPRDEWLAKLEQARVPAGPIYRVDEVVEDVHLRERSMFFTVERRGVALPQVGLGIHFDGHAPGCVLPPPLLGEHSHDVLSLLAGLGEAEIASLAEQGIVGLRDAQDDI